MAPKRKSDIKMVAPDKNNKSTTNGGQSSAAVSDYYQNLLNNRGNGFRLFGDDERIRERILRRKR